MRKKIFYFAVFGWLISLLLNVILIFNHAILIGYNDISWLLHGGILIVFIPGALYLKKDFALKPSDDNRYSQNVMLEQLKRIPVWLAALVALALVYAPINAFLLHVQYEGVPDIWDGQYVLHNHGALIKKLTEQEYHFYRANELRWFSGIWLALYGVATMMLYPFKKTEE